MFVRFFLTESEAPEHQKMKKFADEIREFAFARSRVTRNDHHEHYAVIVVDSFANLRMILGMVSNFV